MPNPTLENSKNSIRKFGSTHGKGGFLYLLIKRSNKVALFQQSDPNNDRRTVGYEVFYYKIS